MKKILIALMSLPLLFACQDQSADINIKLGHGLDTNHPVHKAMEIMAEDLYERSNGTMSITLYPNQQLGSERQVLELLQIGSVGMSKVSAAVLENFAPNVKVVSLPYIFVSRDHAHRVMDSEIGRNLLTESEPFWLRGLVFYDAGSRSYYATSKQIETPTDLDGLKIRVQPSVTAMNMVSAMGGSPTPIAWGELYTALQQGVVDGAENNLPSYYSSRHYEVAPYFSVNEHTSVPDVLMVSTHLWSRLTEQQREWLQTSADLSALRQRQLWSEAEGEALEKIQAAGVSVIYPSKTPFIDSVAPLLEAYKTDPTAYDYIKRIQSMANNNNEAAL